MSKAEAVAAVLLAAATLYAVFGGADFGAGFWQLIAPLGRDPAAIRVRIERSLAPVWEANHVWLIFMLVVLWTGFPEVFAAIMTTLYIPLALAALGIVLRGSGFAFGKVMEGRARRDAGAVFALSSVMTPFFMGTVVGAVAAGEVPAGGHGNATASWIGFVPLTVGALFVASGAYVAAIFLVHDSRAAGEEENARFFSRCALAMAGAAGALAALGLVALHRDAEFVFDGLFGPALALVILSGICGVAVLAILAGIVRGREWAVTAMRPLAVAAVVAIVWGWGIAQHPYLLPEAVKIEAAAAPDATLNALLIVFGAAALVVLPSLALLYALSQRDLLE